MVAGTAYGLGTIIEFGRNGSNSIISPPHSPHHFCKFRMKEKFPHFEKWRLLCVLTANSWLSPWHYSIILLADFHEMIYLVFISRRKNSNVVSGIRIAVPLSFQNKYFPKYF